MTPPDQAQELTLQARAIFAAIPVVLFALWLDYFERSFLGDIESFLSPQKKKPTDSVNTQLRKDEHNQKVELIKEQGVQLLRSMGFTALLTQLLIYFSTRAIPGSSSIYSLIFALLGMGIQFKLQADLEKKIRGPGSPTKPAKIQTTQSIPERRSPQPASAISVLGGFALYVTIVLGSALSFFGAALLMGTSPTLAMGLGGLGIILGIITGLTLIYALAPWHLKRMYPTEKLRDISTLRTIERAFGSVQIPKPECYIIEQEHIHSHNAMIAGFHRGKGVFKPALFITRSLIENFSPHELEAIILHELSHITLRHLKKRLILTASVIVGFIFCGAVIALLGFAFLPETWARAIQIASTVAAIFFPFRLIKRQIWNQELEADHHAITRFKASPEAAISALEKLDSLNGRDPSYEGGSHPSTTQRIREIQAAAAQMNKIIPFPTPSKPQSQNQNKAA